ncbi:TIGR03619 family F420-dependent LLM class oxidoreductase [Actinomadura sp. LD22]|uniref:TIGR03619 family F420-dependent LLM class oxidoreductase n=1 Tax=Actinomadura physcomitrii TaxID=2650748 RepID=A0A6I4MF61_9ACTN|nr:TIGR03619 family F420-dependent LLM class oxidoreductase [Actinomadura physcomitrii]MWA03195.1 TIGR03619 family F420-dependent LLM class oxidoreductase [Actinomadura physcomitrii]
MTVFGISLLRVHPRHWRSVTEEAERLGYESVWLSEHLVLPAEFDGSRYPDGRPPIRTETPLFDVMVFLAALAARTTTLRLGTYIYQLALRSPFVAARAATTLDVVSDGRLELGVGAGWMEEEWTAAGVPFTGRGRRLEEAIEVCRRLWSEPVIEHHGEFFDFPPVAFEPKPVQRPLPVHVGGESAAALRRAAGMADGWIGMHHSPESVAPVLGALRQAEAAAGRRTRLTTTVAAHPGPGIDAAGWRATGVDRVLVSPWSRSSEAIEGMRRFAGECMA